MPQTPDTYTSTVCTCLRHATAKEKAAVRAELAAHIEDHAAALLEAGYDTDHAHQQAVAAMGDPQEMGAILNREFPLRWLVLSRLALVLLLLLAVFPSLWLFPSLPHVPSSLLARWDPMASSLHFTGIPEEDLTPLSISLPFPNGDVIDLYAVALLPEGDTYAALVYGVAYQKNPLRTPQYDTADLSYTFGTPPFSTPGLGYSSSYRAGAFYDVQKIPGLAPGDTLTAHFQHYGIQISVELPLPWEEVLAP